MAQLPMPRVPSLSFASTGGPHPSDLSLTFRRRVGLHRRRQGLRVRPPPRWDREPHATTSLRLVLRLK